MEKLTKEKYEKFKKDDRFIHNVIFAHQCGDSNGKFLHYKAMTKYTNAGEDFEVTEKQIKTAKKEYNKRKNKILKNIDNKLVFVGMGMSFKPSTINHIGNHRIRTYFKNNKGILCFVEFGTARDKDFLRCDHALMNTKKDNSEWESLSERDKKEKRISLESIKGDYIEFTKENVLELINKSCDCSFKEVEVEDYFISTDDFTCEVKK